MQTLGIKSSHSPNTLGIKQQRTPNTMGIKTHMVYRNNNVNNSVSNSNTVHEHENLGLYEPLKSNVDKKSKKSYLEKK